MDRFIHLAKQVVEAGYEIYWYGKASETEVRRLEALLEMPLPASFTNFLLTFGGGGIVSAEISGIEANNAELLHGGTV
jgi:hypothetical protein